MGGTMRGTYLDLLLAIIVEIEPVLLLLFMGYLDRLLWVFAAVSS